MSYGDERFRNKGSIPASFRRCIRADCDQRTCYRKPSAYAKVAVLLCDAGHTQTDSDDVCHCGSEYFGSDHCPDCGCEQYESLVCHGRMSAIEDPRDRNDLHYPTSRFTQGG